MVLSSIGITALLFLLPALFGRTSLTGGRLKTILVIVFLIGAIIGTFLSGGSNEMPKEFTFSRQFYPETEDREGYRQSGFSRKEQLSRIILFSFVTARRTGIAYGIGGIL